APLRPDQHPRSHGLSEDPVGLRPDARRPVGTGARPVRRARLEVRRTDPNVTDPAASPPAAGAAPTPARLGALLEHPQLAAVAGALCLAFSGILVREAAVSPSTAAVFRCLYALPVLALLAWLEGRRYGPLEARTIRL